MKRQPIVTSVLALLMAGPGTAQDRQRLDNIPRVARMPMPSASDAVRVPLPSEAAMGAAMQDAQRRAQGLPGTEALDAARRRAQVAADPRQFARDLPTGAFIDAPPASGPKGRVDPMEVAQQYRQAAEGTGEDERFNLLIFVSLSMPEAALTRLAMDAKKAGGVVVLRGMKYGLQPGTWARSLEAMKPLAQTGANVQINPELFKQFGVRAVPLVVVTANPVGDKGCGDGSCAAGIGSVAGDVTLGYALEQLADRSDAVGAIARQRAAKLE